MHNYINPEGSPCDVPNFPLFCFPYCVDKISDFGFSMCPYFVTFGGLGFEPTGFHLFLHLLDPLTDYINGLIIEISYMNREGVGWGTREQKNSKTPRKKKREEKVKKQTKTEGI